MLNIIVDKGSCRFRGAGSRELLDIEMTCAGAAIIDHMAKIKHCSFETAALMLLQQSSLIYKDNEEEFENNFNINAEEK
jgi:hypothetical protein